MKTDKELEELKGWLKAQKEGDGTKIFLTVDCPNAEDIIQFDIATILYQARRRAREKLEAENKELQKDLDIEANSSLIWFGRANEFRKENANLKQEVKRNCEDRKKYLDERNRLAENVKILSDRELTGKVLLEQEDSLRAMKEDLEEAYAEVNDSRSIICDLENQVAELKRKNNTSTDLSP